MSRENLWDKRVFSPKKSKFDILFWFLMKKFRICGRSFQQGCPKQNPRDQKTFGKTLSGGRYNFISFDGFSEENLICKKTQGSSVRHSTRPVEHSKGRESGRNKTFLTFGHWARIFRVSGKTKLAELPKLHSMWPEQILEKVELFLKEKFNFSPFPDFKRKTSMFLEKQFASGVESATFASTKNFKRKTGRTRKAFYVSSGAEHFGEVILAETKTFWLLGKEREVAGFLAKQFWRSCQHRIPYVQRKSLRQTGFFPKKK